jgi:hypothetical protein
MKRSNRMPRTAPLAALAPLALVALAAGLAGCRGQTSKESPIFGIRNMYDQPRYDVQEESPYFDDKRTMRPIPDGTVPRERDPDRTVTTGRTDDNMGYLLTVPKSVVDAHGGMEQTLLRGQERYGIFCAPCHDNTGSGQGMVKKRAVAGLPPRPHSSHARRAALRDRREWQEQHAGLPADSGE